MKSRSRRVVPDLRHAVSLALLVTLVAGCGGGGGGGGSKGGNPGGSSDAAVNFLGFTFRVGNGAPFSTPPDENLTKVPPSLGAPLDITLIFNFDGVPQGPFNQQDLPVFTTPDEITPDAGATISTPIIQAKGTYVLVDKTVEFHPFVPTQPLQISLSAPAEAVPGLFPGSTYTGQVVTASGLKIPNLKGAGGTVKFDTTSLPAAYFSGGVDASLAPRVVASVPGDGATGVSPGPFSNFAPNSTLPSFPPDPPLFTLTFDHPLSPTTDNLEGKDWDGDGYVDPSFFLRSQATRLLIATTVPGGSTLGNAQPFPALSGLVANQAVTSDGADIFLHGPSSFPGGDAGLNLTPSSLAVGRDPDLLYVVLRVDGGTDRLSVVDHVLGDPSSADIASASLDTGLGNLTGLTMLQSGRLVAYDTGTRRIYELMPTVIRNRPLGEPVLTQLAVGDGSTGFRSDVFPVGTDVIDLAQSPNGDLYALVGSGGSFPSVQLLAPIDPDLNGAFDAGEGLPVGAPVLSLSAQYAAISFIDADTLYALNRSTDAIDTLSLAAGFTGAVVQGVAAYGVPLGGLPGGLSPALDLEVGYMNSDVQTSVLSNEAAGAVVQLKPRGVMPIGERIDVMQRNALASSTGVSLANENPAAPMSVLGADRVLTVTTSDPLNTVGPCAEADIQDRVNDVKDETFTDTALEDPTPTGLSPLAEWAKPIAGGGTSGHLRASVGADDDPVLGDFLPVPDPNFAPQLAYPQVGGPGANPLANFKYVFLDTDVQNFPLPNGETPNVTQNVTVFGGDFQFHDFIIPAGVWVRAKGTRPLKISTTGKVEISGVLDLSGSPGQDDITFNSAFIPVGGGSGGAGGGKGGDGQPTLEVPKPPAPINGVFVAAYATPETGERGFGPVLTTGGFQFGEIGGEGGISTLGYQPDANGYPRLADTGNNTEYSRPPGGGGGSFLFHGIPSHVGTGSYRVQSSSSWGNFTLCPTNDKKNDATYGLEELQYCFGQAPRPLQCVYMQGTLSNPVRFQPAAKGGQLIFADGDSTNDYFGGNGELQVLIGGQGGGGGGTRVDSMKHSLWGTYPFGFPTNPLPPLGGGPPCYPNLFIGFFAAPSAYDAKGGGGGGGAGSVQILSFGDIRITRTGHILAFGGDGGGGETIGNSNYSGGGGGGSGGAVILQAAGDVIIEADSNHVFPGATDSNMAQGASIDVSGGRGCDASEDPGATTSTPGGKSFGQFTRSDGGQGGFGLIQLQAGSGDNHPTVQQGAFLFAKQYATIKRWQTPTAMANQKENTWFTPPNAQNAGADFLRYIDELYYRSFQYDAGSGTITPWFVLNGSDPGIIEVSNPGAVTQYQLDTPMMDYFGKRVVKEPEPQKILKTYNGFDANFKEIGPNGQLPGTPYLASDEIPLSIWLKEPDGTPPTEVVEGIEQFKADNLVDRLPVVQPSKTAPEFGTVSRGTSKWLDFNGVALRFRDNSGLAPPLFDKGFNGTYNALNAPPPVGKDGQVITKNAVGGIPAHFVANTGLFPFDPGLCTQGPPPFPEFNDVKVDALEFSTQNAVTDNATVTVLFQGSLPIRAGSHVPDPDTLTAWTSDLSQLSGYALIRFQVVFDVSVDHNLYPFGINSMRPAVDRVRIRARY